MKQLKLVESLEGLAPNGGASSGSSQSLETEVVLYCRIGNPEALENAVRKEEHVQLEGEFVNGTRCRVRKTTRNEEVSYVFTYKLKDRKEQNDTVIESSDERNAVVDEAFFQGFYKIAFREIHKVRYVFSSQNVTLSLTSSETGEPVKVQLPNVEFEVDVFTNQPEPGTLWCKIDVEVDNILNFVKEKHPELKDVKLHLGVSNLPFAPQDIIQAATDDGGQRDRISELWKVFAKSLLDMTPAK